MKRKKLTRQQNRYEIRRRGKTEEEELERWQFKRVVRVRWSRFTFLHIEMCVCSVTSKLFLSLRPAYWDVWRTCSLVMSCIGQKPFFLLCECVTWIQYVSLSFFPLLSRWLLLWAVMWPATCSWREKEKIKKKQRETVKNKRLRSEKNTEHLC